MSRPKAMTKRSFLWRGATAVGLIALGPWGFSSAAEAQVASEPLKLVATTGMIADAARKIGGDHVRVTALMGPGVDPHAYRQTRSDIVAMAKADLVLWHGLYLEAQMEDFFVQLARKTRVVAVAEALPKGVLIGHDDYADKFDPHVWMDPRLWSNAVLAVRDALTEARPEQASDFATAAEEHLAELRELAAYADDVLATVPPESRVLLTAHDAFNYFGRAYGFEVLGVQGISTESEAGLNRISALVETLVTRKIGAVFVESSVSDRNLRALIEGAAAQGWTVKIGGELYSDAMGPPGTYEGAYLGMIDHNVTTIARALGGAAPEAGRLGRLGAS
ncbi:MAG: zinc ABC transporter substrate-binding protein [Rhodobacteraceae bacterium]|nr:zinc ABC transporter substrate-binding protein [Paracoccaceae bacterium]